MEKKTTLTERMIILINTEIDRVMASNTVMDLETKGYLQGLNEARKMIEQNIYDVEIRNIISSYDEGYFQGSELTEQTADEYVENTFKTINNKIIL